MHFRTVYSNANKHRKQLNVYWINAVTNSNTTPRAT